LARIKQTCSVWDFISEIDEIQTPKNPKHVCKRRGKGGCWKGRSEWRLQKRIV
jgi:hypothetical protein